MSEVTIKQLIAHANALERQRGTPQHNPIELLNALKTVAEMDITALDDLVQVAGIAERTRQHKLAAKWFQLAFQKQPSNALRRAYLINLLESGQATEAENEARAALKKSPKEESFLNILGVALKRQDRINEAIDAFSQLAKLNPKSASAWMNLGNSYSSLEQFPKALEAYTKLTQVDAKSAEHFRLLGRTYMQLGEREKAIAALGRASKLAPNNLQVNMEIVGVYFQFGEPALAWEENAKLIAMAPNNKNLIRNHGKIARKLGRIETAKEIYESLLAADPNDVETILVLGNLLCYDFNDRKAANTWFEHAMTVAPDNIELASAYVNSLTNSRYGDESEHFAKAYQIALRILAQPKPLLSVSDDLQSILLRNVDYEHLKQLGEKPQLMRYWLNRMNVGALHNQLGRVESMQDRLDLVSIHREWGDKVQALANPNAIVHSPRTGPRKKIRIGFMSSDLRHHPVTYFVQPIIEKYDRNRFELYCYSFYPREADGVQQRIAQVVDHFGVYDKLSNQQIAQQMANDQLDILFELGGTTLLNKVQVCAYRPAPVQVSWLGYPHSAGISAIDYLLVDPYTMPADPALMIEKPFLMPETWVTLGDLGFAEVPIDAGIPEKRQGHVTFGTANNPYKYTPACFAAWAAVMLRVPHSRFLFLRPEGGTATFRDNVCRQFAMHGVSADRIEFVAVRGTHLPHYNKMDITLDPFPHVGGTTTCESLWMGVPTVTLIGPSMFERLSYSNLSNAGLGDLCAHTVDDYVEKAVQLAQDTPRREALRHGLRQQIREHPLGQAERFVRQFEAQIEKVLAENT